MKRDDPTTATFEVQEDGRSRVLGSLDLTSVGALLKAGSDAVRQGRAAVIDLQGVTSSDSAGLALLIEWLSVAKAVKQPLRYDNIPEQLNQIARLSDVEELLTISAGS